MHLLDVGANRGSWADAALLKSTDARVVCVEPNPDLANYLRAKYMNDPRVIVEETAVGPTDKTHIDFFVANAETISTCDTAWIIGSRFSSTHTWAPAISVMCTCLDALISKHGPFDLVKLDIEGFELTAILTLSKHVPLLCFEFADEKFHDALKICVHLSSIGFTRFAMQLQDPPMQKPPESDFIELGPFMTLLSAKLDPERKLVWGMIWAH